LPAIPGVPGPACSDQPPRAEWRSVTIVPGSGAILGRPGPDQTWEAVRASRQETGTHSLAGPGSKIGEPRSWCNSDNAPHVGLSRDCSTRPIGPAEIVGPAACLAPGASIRPIGGGGPAANPFSSRKARGASAHCPLPRPPRCCRRCTRRRRRWQQPARAAPPTH
jgi:hypothetical protein